MLRMAAFILTNAAHSSSVLSSASKFRGMFYVFTIAETHSSFQSSTPSLAASAPAKVSCIDMSTRWAFNTSVSLESFKLRSDKTCCASPNNTTTYLERMPRNPSSADLFTQIF